MSLPSSLSLLSSLSSLSSPSRPRWKRGARLQGDRKLEVEIAAVHYLDLSTADFGLPEGGLPTARGSQRASSRL